MCNPPILSPSLPSSKSLSSPSSSSSSLYSNTNFYAKNIRNGASLYRPMAELMGPTSNSSPPPPRFFLSDDTISDEEEEQQNQYSLDFCFLCKTHLYWKDDVYMYKGELAFCTEECRQDQIEIDQAKEKKKKSRLKKKSMINNKNSSSSASHEIHGRVAGTVMAG